MRSARRARGSADDATTDTSAVPDSHIAFAVLCESTFRRRDDRLILRREQTDQGYQLVITESGHHRTFTFRDGERLVVFQHDMEDFLLRTGWSLAEFAPDRRGGGDWAGLPGGGNGRGGGWAGRGRGGRLAGGGV